MKKEIDNIEIILPFINPQSEDEFYFLQLLKRKKENPELGSNSVVIRNYYIKSKEHLLKVYSEVKEICRVTNSRAMIQLNKRSFENVFYQFNENVAHCLKNKDFINMSNQYDRAIGQTNADKENKWIVDIDEPFNETEHAFLTFCINNLQPVGREKELAIIPSKSGYHLISRPFNKEEFNKIYTKIDIQKNNPTNLFIP